jgi:hypothetical protein
MANSARKHGVNSQHHHGSYLLEVQKDDLHLEPPGPLCESDCAFVRPKEPDHLAPEPLHPPQGGVSRGPTYAAAALGGKIVRPPQEDQHESHR